MSVSGHQRRFDTSTRKSRSFARAQDDACAIFFACDLSPLFPRKTWWSGDNFATFFMLVIDVDVMRIAPRFVRCVWMNERNLQNG
jgi:hypothetical protein